jgi:hypothetical protein
MLLAMRDAKIHAIRAVKRGVVTCHFSPNIGHGHEFLAVAFEQSTSRMFNRLLRGCRPRYSLSPLRAPVLHRRSPDPRRVIASQC